MNDRVARPFLPPYGHQLAPASETEADVKASTKQSGKKGG
jgi:hypothetical protein